MAGITGGLGRHYHYSRHGQLWVAAGVGDVTGQVSFAETTPTWIIYGAGLGKRIILSQMILTQTGTPAGGAIDLRIYVAPSNRFSSGGNAQTPVNTNAQRAETFSASFRDGATAAAGTDERLILNRSIAVLAGDTFKLPAELEEVVQFEGTGSILIYTSAATTGPTWDWVFRLVEEDI